MTPTQRIAYIIGSMRRGGAEGQVVRLLKHFRGGEFESSLYLLSEEGEHLEELRALGVKVRGFGFKKSHANADPRTLLLVRRTVNRMADAMRQDRPDVVHAFLYWANILGTWAARRAGVERIVTSRRSLGDYKDGRRWMQWLENRANRHASAVTVNSEAVRADVLRREKIDPAKIRLIYNGVEVGSPPEPRRIAAELIAAFDAVPAPPPRLKLIVCVANLIHYKGHPTLIEAMERVAAAEPSARLLLVGRDGGMEGAIREAIARRGLTERIAILGATNRPEIVYRAADVVVLPSHEEGFSNVILEAMAAGRAIVATAVGGTPEAARDGREAWLVPPRDAGALATALTAALGDSAERERLAAAARRRVEDLFSLARMHGDYEMLYRELVQ